LGLGTNLGYKGKSCKQILTEAIKEIKNYLGITGISHMYETEAQGKTDQNNFLNMAVKGNFNGTAYDLLAKIELTETMFGRNRITEARWGERSLDIDILIFGNNIINDAPKLVIPHQELNKRRFALVPLLELIPDATEEGTGIPYSKICNDLPHQGVILLEQNISVLDTDIVFC